MRSILLSSKVSDIDEITGNITPLFFSLFKIASEKGRGGGQGTRVVIVVPGFKTQQGWVDMDPVSDNTDIVVNDETEAISEHPLQWDRPNSIIRRNIKILAF